MSIKRMSIYRRLRSCDIYNNQIQYRTRFLWSDKLRIFLQELRTSVIEAFVSQNSQHDNCLQYENNIYIYIFIYKNVLWPRTKIYKNFFLVTQIFQKHSFIFKNLTKEFFLEIKKSLWKIFCIGCSLISKMFSF